MRRAEVANKNFKKNILKNFCSPCGIENQARLCALCASVVKFFLNSKHVGRRKVFGLGAFSPAAFRAPAHNETRSAKGLIF
jgi:hypothetical protein